MSREKSDQINMIGNQKKEEGNIIGEFEAFSVLLTINRDKKESEEYHEKRPTYHPCKQIIDQIASVIQGNFLEKYGEVKSEDVVEKRRKRTDGIVSNKVDSERLNSKKERDDKWRQRTRKARSKFLE